MAWTAKVRLSTSLQVADSVTLPTGEALTSPLNHFDLFNGTFGVNLRIRQLTMVTMDIRPRWEATGYSTVKFCAFGIGTYLGCDGGR